MKRHHLYRLLFGTLRGRLMLSVAIVHAVMMSLFIVDLTRRQRTMLLERQAEQAAALSQALSTTAAGWLAASDLAGLQELVDAQRRYPELAFAILTDSVGRILAHTDRARVGKYLIDLPREMRPERYTDAPLLADVATPAVLAGRLVGWARVGIAQGTADRALSATTRFGVGYGLAAILIGSLIAWLLGRRITRRLYAVQDTIAAVKAGDPTTRVRMAGDDESALLAREFDVMLDALAEREEKLRASDAHARAVIDASPVPIALNDEAGRITYLNPAFVRTFGYTREDIPTVADWWPKAYSDAAYRQQVTDAWNAELSRSVQTGTAFETQELVVRCKDGTECVVVVHATSWSHDGALHHLVMFHDLTERRRAEAAHRLESAALHAVANTVVITSRAGLIAWANPAFTTCTGYSLEEAVGRTPGDLLGSGEHDPAFYDALWHTILAGDVWRGEIINKRKDGSRYTEEMTITPLSDAGGAITHFIAVKQDITQRKVLEAQLQQAQKMESVGLLAGGVAHDFNNMLGVILGTTELAIAEVDAAQPLHEDLLEIRKAALRSSDLTRQLLAFARQQTIAPAVLDLNETVPGMLSMLERLIGEDIRLHWQPATALWPVMMDASQMDQILTNLCVNARHAIANVGTVAIATANVVADAAFCSVHAEAVPGDFVQLSVRDTGSGMDAETQARIFEPFFSTKGVGAGTGLGLATVYGAVKQNQGFVTVASTLGEGTTFDIYLPRHEGAATPARKTGPVAADLRGNETILLVEDEPSLMRLVTKALEAQGYVVLAANSASDALRRATAYADEIHLLVSDVVMPEMNGRDLAQTLLALRPTLKPLFMSGYTADIIATRGLLAPGVAFIEKPFTSVALAAKVREVLDGG